MIKRKCYNKAICINIECEPHSHYGKCKKKKDNVDEWYECSAMESNHKTKQKRKDIDGKYKHYFTMVDNQFEHNKEITKKEGNAKGKDNKNEILQRMKKRRGIKHL